jgi:adenylate cyclase
MRRTLHIIGLRLRRIWRALFGLSLLGTLVATLWWRFDVLQISDNERSAYDDGLSAFTLPKRELLKYAQRRFGLGKPHRSEEVVVVALDDATMSLVAGSEGLRERYGANLPFDRRIWADLVRFLSRAGARLVVFDMVMNEQSSDGTGDLALADALRASKTPVLLGFNTSATAAPLPKVEATMQRPVGPMPAPPVKETPEGEFPEAPTPEEQKALDAQAAATRLEWAAKAYALPVTVAGGLELPSFPTEADRDEQGNPLETERAHYPMPALPRMLEAMSGFGTVTSEEDDDGKLRRTAFAYTDGNNAYATLPVAAFATLEHAEGLRLEPGLLTLGAQHVRINGDGTAEISFGGTLKDRFRLYSLGGVVQRMAFCEAREARETTEPSGHPERSRGDAGPDDDCPEGPSGQPFAGKVVVVGGIAVGTGDSKATPLEKSTPGLIKQAAVLDNLLRDEFVIEAPLWISVLFGFFTALFSVCLVLVVRNSFVDIGWPVLLYVGFFLITGGVLVTTHVHLLSAMPAFAGTVASILATTWERLFAHKERDRIKDLFANYMEKDLVELMVEQHTLPSLEGENLEVTAFFSDIRGFSTFSEQLHDDPRTLIRVLNRYLSVVTPELTDEGACIDKYIGDSVVALFGAPVYHADHALRACRGALSVQRAIAELREVFRKEGLPDVYTRIGINSGKMMVGNIGSEQLLDYTAIGDEMNLASRLEGANKAFGTLILLGPGTMEMVAGHVEARELDLVRVAGKHHPVAVYELLGLKGEVPEALLQVVAGYERALGYYRARHFEQARALLQTALTALPTDGPSLRLLKLCQGCIATPPTADWDAVANLDK